MLREADYLADGLIPKLRELEHRIIKIKCDLSRVLEWLGYHRIIKEKPPEGSPACPDCGETEFFTVGVDTAGRWWYFRCKCCHNAVPQSAPGARSRHFFVQVSVSVSVSVGKESREQEPSQAVIRCAHCGKRDARLEP